MSCIKPILKRKQYLYYHKGKKFFVTFALWNLRLDFCLWTIFLCNFVQFTINIKFDGENLNLMCIALQLKKYDTCSLSTIVSIFLPIALYYLIVNMCLYFVSYSCVIKTHRVPLQKDTLNMILEEGFQPCQLQVLSNLILFCSRIFQI